MINGKPFIAVVTARASEREQRIMLDGIMKEAERYGVYIGVISNIYNLGNIREYFSHLDVENKIYELIYSERIDGIIFMSETFPMSDFRAELIKRLNEIDKPVVVAGDAVEGILSINNDVRSDIRDITRHLTEVHGFTDIDIITGPEEFETSIERIDGVRDILSEKGIDFKEDNVVYGTFWTDSGERLAEEYISGKRRLPQAVICANDYMAYGLIDMFFKNNITPPDDVTVVGYEYSGERYYHSPILTTYYRNRSALGAKVFHVLYGMISGNEPKEIDMNGYMVCGNTCPCGIDKKFLIKELEEVRTKQFYNNMTMCGNFEQQLAVCRNLNDYIRTLQDYSYLVRNAEGLYLCLYENWDSIKEKSEIGNISNEKMMTFYRLISPIEYTSEPMYFTRKMLFPENLPGAGDKFFLYFVPMFADSIEIGYFIFQYTAPDGYDPTITGWINSAVNALNVIRMKNDINELMEYNNLSAFIDTPTGLYNNKGITREIKRAVENADDKKKVCAVLIKTRLFFDNSRIDEKSISIKIDVEIAECLKKIGVECSAFCAKIQEKQFMFVVFGEFPEDYHDTIADRLLTLITHSPFYREAKDMDNIIYSGITEYAKETSAEEIIETLSEDINRKTSDFFERRSVPGYASYSAMRTNMYKSPEKEWAAENICREFHISSGHFRAEYKNMFGISFHKDLIVSRISFAKYLLMTTALNLPAIAMKCGYDDDKYFMRQFRQITGMSPNNYRRFSI